MTPVDINFDNYLSSSSIKNATKSMTINEAGIDNLAIQTMQTAKIINDYLNRIIDVIDDTKFYYKTPAATTLRTKFNDISRNFPLITQNIENYAFSLKKVKQNYLNHNEIVISKLSRDTLNVEELIKKEGN